MAGRQNRDCGWTGQRTTHTKEYKDARTAYNGFLDRLNRFRVLDPACGSGNFLYLALKALRDVEKQVRIEAQDLGFAPELWMQTGPHNILGIEINEYAAELARVTVWIGDIQCAAAMAGRLPEIPSCAHWTASSTATPCSTRAAARQLGRRRM